jgi:hypothetical protein
MVEVVVADIPNRVRSISMTRPMTIIEPFSFFKRHLFFIGSIL